MFTITQSIKEILANKMMSDSTIVRVTKGDLARAICHLSHELLDQRIDDAMPGSDSNTVVELDFTDKSEFKPKIEHVIDMSTKAGSQRFNAKYITAENIQAALDTIKSDRISVPDVAEFIVKNFVSAEQKRSAQGFRVDLNKVAKGAFTSIRTRINNNPCALTDPVDIIVNKYQKFDGSVKRYVFQK